MAFLIFMGLFSLFTGSSFVEKMLYLLLFGYELVFTNSKKRIYFCYNCHILVNLILCSEKICSVHDSRGAAENASVDLL